MSIHEVYLFTNICHNYFYSQKGKVHTFYIKVQPVKAFNEKEFAYDRVVYGPRSTPDERGAEVMAFAAFRKGGILFARFESSDVQLLASKYSRL